MERSVAEGERKEDGAMRNADNGGRDEMRMAMPRTWNGERWMRVG